MQPSQCQGQPPLAFPLAWLLQVQVQKMAHHSLNQTLLQLFQLIGIGAVALYLFPCSRNSRDSLFQYEEGSRQSHL
ncbi:hypothetical protein IC582_017931 [Cucumis melo]